MRAKAHRNALRAHISHVLQASPPAQKHLPTLLRCTDPVSRHFSTDLGLEVPCTLTFRSISVQICMWVLQITLCFIIGEHFIRQIFTIRQTAKLKSSPNFPAILWYAQYDPSQHVNVLYINSEVLTISRIPRRLAAVSCYVRDVQHGIAAEGKGVSEPEPFGDDREGLLCFGEFQELSSLEKIQQKLILLLLDV